MLSTQPEARPNGSTLHTHASLLHIRGGVNQVLWTEQFSNGHPRKLDREILKIAFLRKLDPSKISRYTVHHAHSYIHS